MATFYTSGVDMHIDDQVMDNLSCDICYEQYTDPKFLDCLHTFCRPCIEKYVQKNHEGKTTFPCPTCRKRTKIPPNGVKDLMSNFYIPGMMSEDGRVKVSYQRSPNSYPPCDACKSTDENVTSETRCLECEEFLCNICTSAHRKSKLSRDHKIFTIEEMHSEKYQQELRALQFTYCKLHQMEPLQIYCTTCKKSICLKCKALDHEKHKPVPIEDITNETKEKLDVLLKDLKNKQCEFDQAVYVAKLEMQKSSNMGEQAKTEIKQRGCLLQQMIEKCIVDMCDSADVKSKENEQKLAVIQKSNSLASESIASVIASLEPLLNQGKPAEIMEMSENFIPRIQELMVSDPQPLPLLGMPCIETIPKPELAAVQEVMGAVISKSGSVEKILEINLELKEPTETLSHISATPDGDIVIGIWADDEKKRRIYVYNRNGEKKCTFSVPGLRGLCAMLDGRIAVTVWPETKQEVRLYTMKGKKSQSFFCTQPGTVAVDSIDHFFVTQANATIRKFTTDGKESLQFDQLKSKAEYKYFKEITVNHAHNDDIIISDPNDHCLYVYNSSGELQFAYGSQGFGDGQFNRPNGVCCNYIGDILVADRSNDRVHLVSATGEFKCFLLTKEDHIDRPNALAVLPDGCFVVGETSGTVKVYKYM